MNPGNGDPRKATDSEHDDLPAGLGRPARRASTDAGYTRIEQFADLSDADLLRLHGMGPKAVRQIREALVARGLAPGESDPRAGG